jgi:hypothetical protein
MSLIARTKQAVNAFFNRSPRRESLAWDAIPPLDADDLEDMRLFFSRPKFFIFGHARSGTTLLARLIRVHPEVHCNWQAHFFSRPPFLHSLTQDAQVHEWLTRRSNRWNGGKDLSPLVLRAAADFILEREAQREGKSIVGDKSPNSLVHGEAVRRLHHIYPDARLIYIVRDGRDAALSHRFQSFIDKSEYLSEEDLAIRQAFSKDPQPFLRGERSLFTPKAIRRAAESWVQNVTETHRLGQELYRDLYFSLRFEDLLHQPWEQMRSLWAFLGADVSRPELPQILDEEMRQNPDADWQQQKASDLAQPLQKGKSGSWREIFTPSDRQVFLEVAGETLRSWGYSLIGDA